MTEDTSNTHYLILRYNGGTIEILKGAEYQIRALFTQFKDALLETPKTLLIVRINLLLDISELHSVQMVGDDEGSEILDSLVPPDNDLPYYYPELRETKDD